MISEGGVSVNSEIRDLWNKIVLLFNQSGLQIEVKKLIAQGIFLQIQAEADRVVQVEEFEKQKNVRNVGGKDGVDEQSVQPDNVEK